MAAGLSSVDIQDALQRAKELAAASSKPADNDFGGYGGADQGGQGMSPNGMGGNAFGGGDDQCCETIEVPDPSVGLIIGRGGEQISNIQKTSGCRVQMAPESGPKPTRTCTLTGSPDAIGRARQMVNDIVERASTGRRNDDGGMGGGDSGFMNGGQSNGGGRTTFEIMIPGNKCGMIIGKNGETIKSLQERTGAKIMLIQDQQQQGPQPKPLRIMGDPEQVEFAKQLVDEILNREDTRPQGQQSFGQYQGGMGGGGGSSCGEVIVPRSCVGLIIGKGGEMIKKLAAESGARIQFKTENEGEAQDAPERTAVIQGNIESIQRATQLITDLVQRNMSDSQTFYMHVPANKTGLVIGRGGETIKGISGESGAHVELSRDEQSNPGERVFVIRGSPQQIHVAQHLIRIKIAPGTPCPQFAGAPTNGAAAQAPAFGGGFQQAQAYGQPQPGQWPQQGYPAAQTGGDQQQAAWAQYYAQQQAQQAQQQQPNAQAAAQAAMYGAYQQPQQQQQMMTAGSNSSSALASNGGADYSAQWVEYYRSMGMHEQAQMIEQHRQQQGQQYGGAAAGAPAQAQPAQAQQQAQQYGGFTGGTVAAAPQPAQQFYQPQQQQYQ